MVCASIGMLILAAPGGVEAQARDDMLLLSAVIVVPVVLVALYFGRKSRLRTEALIEEQRRANAQSQQHLERDQKAYAQHVALNDLTAEKIKLESQYLQLQMKIGELEVENRERGEEYHRLMTDKTRLEIQSLKLHIREQTKRLDDYSGYGDD